jgi:3-phenylpropionate/trans-cinnamate dioxygenase ferredoxin reductase subunit
MTPDVYVIVGGSLAGAEAAAGLREGGFDGRVVLIGSEPWLPYARPELSKGYLTGRKTMSDMQVRPPDFYSGAGIEVMTSTTVTSVDPVDRLVQLDGGGALGYERLLLATGASPRTLDVPGGHLPGVLSLRTVDDADVLREGILSAERVVVVGSGWIGCEVAACARTLGAEVAMVSPDPYPLLSVLGPQVAAVVRDLHADHGVALHLGSSVEAVVGTDRAQGVRTTDGTTVAGDLVVVGIGAAPRDGLARRAGIDVDDGILVDEYLRTSNPRVFAAGDVASAWHPVLGARLRVEHWDNAIKQGRAAAANMLEGRTAYTQRPFFFSDQYDLALEYRGHARGGDQVVLRGDPASGAFLAFWLQDGRVVATLNANVWDQADALDALLGSRATPDPQRLADPEVDLADLVEAGP